MNEMATQALLIGCLTLIGVAALVEKVRASNEGLGLRQWAEKYPAKAVAWTLVAGIMFISLNLDGGAVIYTSVPANFTPELPPGFVSLMANLSNASQAQMKHVTIFNQTVVIP